MSSAMSSIKLSPRTRHNKQKKQVVENSTSSATSTTSSNTSTGVRVVMPQVHKPIVNQSDNYQHSDPVDSRKKQHLESDKNENYNVQTTPSREISVDGETQINTKILALIETEMKRDINKHSHFTESRPQSLSFYEDEKMPEELSGNLELLSPEEKRHYSSRKRKEYAHHQLLDSEDQNKSYNTMQDLYNNSRDPDEVLINNSNHKRSKSSSRKKRHGGGGDSVEIGLGDSREMMIPKEKKKSKKKRRDQSPLGGSNGNVKKKHKNRTREEDHLYQKNDIHLALEELQDDVFESNSSVVVDYVNKAEQKMKKSPRRSDKVYVQKKSKFEETIQHQQKHNHSTPLSRQTAQDLDSLSNLDKGFGSSHPIQIAVLYQKWWMRLANLCHGLLGGLGLGHWLYIMCNIQYQDYAFLLHYAHYSDIYVGLFFALCVLCLVSVFDKIDLAHINSNDLSEFCKHKKITLVQLIYIACLIVHLSSIKYDDRLSLLAYQNYTLSTTMTVPMTTTEANDVENVTNQTTVSIAVGISNGNDNKVLEQQFLSLHELKIWNYLSLWRALLAFTAWIILGLGPTDDLLYNHLKSMERYLPNS